MKQIWVKIKVVDDPVLGAKVRTPDFGDFAPRIWVAIVGEPYGKHPDLPNFKKPLGAYMLVEIEGGDAAILEREAPEKIIADADVPDDIQMITELTLCGPKPELKRFKFDEDKASVHLDRRKDKFATRPEECARARRVLMRMVAQGVMPEDVAVRLAKVHELDAQAVAVTGEPIT